MGWVEQTGPAAREPGQRQRHRPVDEWHFPEERVKGINAQAKRRIPPFVEAVSLKVRCVGDVVN